MSESDGRDRVRRAINTHIIWPAFEKALAVVELKAYELVGMRRFEPREYHIYMQKIAQVPREQRLHAMGWSDNEIQLAEDLRYNLDNHLRNPCSPWNFRYGQGPELMFDWLRHVYRQSKAASIGMAFDDFVKCCQRAVVLVGPYRVLDPLIRCYVKGRAAGMSDEQAMYEVVNRFM